MVLIYKICNKKKSKTYDFQKCTTIRPLGREISNGVIKLNDVFEEQVNLINKKKKENKKSIKKKENKKQ